MADDVIGVGERAAERQDDAAPQRFGDAAGALAELALDRVGLLEVGMRRVEDERLPAAQLMAEDSCSSRASQRSDMRAAMSIPSRSLG